jgi:DNA-binding transcriptional LysR family regulator
VELRHLRSFIETGRAGSFAAAGRRLHLAQPAVWKHVQTLEAELGVDLFERVGRRVTLTPAGRTLLPRAEQVLEGATRLDELAADLRAGRTGTVTIGCLAPHLIGFLATALGVLHRREPSVRVVLREIDIHDDPTEAFDEALRSGTVDMVLGPRLRGADCFLAYEVDAVCAVPPRHRWRRRADVPIEELADERLLLAPVGYFTRTALERTSRARGFELDIAFESTSPSVLVRLGEEGLGVPIIGGDALPVPRRPWPVLIDRGRPLRSEVWLSAHQRRDAATELVFDTTRSMARGAVQAIPE